MGLSLRVAMEDLPLYACEVLGSLKASYGDARLVERRVESIEVKNGAPHAVTSHLSRGIGVRVIYKGSWGFAATSSLTKRAVGKACREAVKIASAGRAARAERLELAPAEPLVAEYTTPFEEDPFEVPLEEKIGILMSADKALAVEPAVKVRRSTYEGFEERRIFASTEGAHIRQRIVQCGGGIMAVAVGNGDSQVRSWPHSFRGNFQSAGFEFVRGMDFTANAGPIASEAAALLTAPPLPEGERTVILEGGQLALQIHESVGHPTELDRVLGFEAGYAGTSFVSPEMLGSYRYGSDHVSITADATEPKGLGTFGYDDEGVPAQRVHLIRDGILEDLMTSRETAGVLSRQANGTMRADGWARMPIVRMTNINLLPGRWSFEDLLADTEDGLYMAVNRAWSIDDKRLNFQFGTEIAYEIKAGRLAKIYKNPSYTGITPSFWASCDAVCGRDDYVMWGTPNCGKGQPGQTARVGHGTAPARFRNVRVGVYQ